jgi:hypothetical protein
MRKRRIRRGRVHTHRANTSSSDRRCHPTADRNTDADGRADTAPDADTHGRADPASDTATHRGSDSVHHSPAWGRRR